MALVLLKTGIVHPGQPGAAKDLDAPYIDYNQMTTAQKLLLFWRKPAVCRLIFLYLLHSPSDHS